jgi:beta-barrel assembly-enhancing protease
MKPRSILCLVLPIAALCLAGASPPDQATRAVETLHHEDMRVAEVGWRLLTANRELCTRRAPMSGVVLYTAAQFGPEYRAAVARLYDVAELVSIGAVVPDSAAARAGLKIGDRLIAIDGRALPSTLPGPRASFDAIADAVARLDRALASGGAMLTVERDGSRRELRFAGDPACASFVQVVPSDEKNAFADGKVVSLTTGAVAFARSADELAALAAHEIAHNVLHHRDRLDAAKVSRGMFAGLGRNGRLIRAAEDEADRLSVYLMARAGFDPAAALSFWEHFGRAADPLIGDGTHAGWRTRVAAMQVEIDRIGSRHGPELALPADLRLPTG